MAEQNNNNKWDLKNEVTSSFKKGRKIKLWQYKEGFKSNGQKWHKCRTSDFHKDNTGTFITDRYYDIWFNSANSFKEGDNITVKCINEVKMQTGFNRDNKFVTNIILNIDIVEDNPNENAINSSNLDIPSDYEDDDDLPY